MEKTLKRAKTPEIWLAKMQKIVQKNGKNNNMDNYTAIAVFLDLQEAEKCRKLTQMM